MPARRVAACVVTGFLGSGKTTLLKALLAREPFPERIAVVVNELGEIGLDGRILTGFEHVENVVELASGCVCCSLDEYRFDLALDELLRRVDPVLLVLETTGVADPGPTLERLRRAGLGVDSVVTVVDAVAWRAAWRVSRVARRQLEAADFVVLSKADLLGEDALARTRREVSRLQPRALLVESGREGPGKGGELLLATSAARAGARGAAGPTVESSSGAAVHSAGGSTPCCDADPSRGPRADSPATAAPAADGHLAQDGIESVAVVGAAEVDRGRLEALLAALPAEVFRAKGVFREAGTGRGWLFHVVCGRVETTPFASGGDRVPALAAVFLGPGVGRREGELRARVLACAAGDERADVRGDDRGLSPRA